uniref:DNA alkylation repair enzyme n=1 Tax=Globodera pallida TaxID=36090 RepID=A0A183CTC1_GLOPA
MAAIELIKENPLNPTALEFSGHIEKYRSPVEAMKLMRYFKTGKGQYGEGDVFMGVRMGQIFEMAKAYIHMPLEEIELLLQSPIHEIRTGALKLLLNDREDLIHKATGWMLRSAGQVNRPQLQKFLDKYAATMPRTLLRYSIEHFDKPLRSHYMGLKRAG